MPKKQFTRNDWSVFNGWVSPEPVVHLPDWSIFDPLEDAAIIYFKHQAAGLTRLLSEWDKALSSFDVDPSRLDWTKFRPLRLGREEDWSDWLGYFIESSKKGDFAKELFSGTGDPQKFIPLCVRREDRTEKHRADIVIDWDARRSFHIEVKLWDQSFEKTFTTSEELQNSKGNRQEQDEWAHYILLPSKAESAWQECAAGIDDAKVSVKVLTWEKVALVIRRALRMETEDVRWRALAYTYLGAIEQKILGFPRIASVEKGGSFLKLQKLSEFSEYLKEGLSNG